MEVQYIGKAFIIHILYIGEVVKLLYSVWAAR